MKVVRTQVLLTQEQVQLLRRIAAERGASVAELIRQSVSRLLEEEERKKRWERSMEAIGMFNCGPSDVSVHHDDYLDEAYG